MWLLCFTFAVNDNFLFIIDTHPVPSHSGGQITGMILKTPKGNVDAVVLLTELSIRDPQYLSKVSTWRQS